MAEATVFIIDDEAGIVSLCSRFLTRAGYEVQGVSDPGKGLETLQDAKFDLLLVDIRMPGLDGFEVIIPGATLTAGDRRGDHDRLRHPGDRYPGIAPGRGRVDPEAI